ncbi:helix-turn-helix domain-containing protein [uncultured Ramlibacter sp.]|uniref:winged helix-turn-helix transcriptional regulator n=1 Tax=uncultured Ramlibacter sp. TaxID=260755 RepID=UPI002606244E|nr:helix-turn-helix domain-containing protein [uncultured Ramlibacter sp.]
MIDYMQFCTVARGAEVLGELWTPLVVRELLCGSCRFNEIHRGVPRMSATLLTQRLRKLEAIGVLERVRAGKSWEYHLTPAGEELRPIVVAIGNWGARWIGSRLRREQLDAGFLMWDIRRFARIDEFPAGRTVVHFRFRDAPVAERSWWLVVEHGSADLCRDDPGHEVTVVVDSTVRSLTEIWTGDSDPKQEIGAGLLVVQGAGRQGQSLWRWLGRSMFAPARVAMRDAAA